MMITRLSDETEVVNIYDVYEEEKRLLRMQRLTPEEYETAIKWLAWRLGI